MLLRPVLIGLEVWYFDTSSQKFIILYAIKKSFSANIEVKRFWLNSDDICMDVLFEIKHKWNLIRLCHMWTNLTNLLFSLNSHESYWAWT